MPFHSPQSWYRVENSIPLWCVMLRSDPCMTCSSKCQLAGLVAVVWLHPSFLPKWFYWRLFLPLSGVCFLWSWNSCWGLLSWGSRWDIPLSSLMAPFFFPDFFEQGLKHFHWGVYVCLECCYRNVVWSCCLAVRHLLRGLPVFLVSSHVGMSRSMGRSMSAGWMSGGGGRGSADLLKNSSKCWAHLYSWCSLPIMAFPPLL